MITVQECVNQIVTKIPFYEDALYQRLINLSALARMIKPEVEKMTYKRVEDGSIIMALKRLHSKVKGSKVGIKSIRSVPDFILRSNLLELTVLNSSSLIDKQKELLEYAHARQLFVTITHGVFETTIIASKELSDKLDVLYAKEKRVYFLDHLSSITLRFTQDIIDTPGVYYMVLKALAWEGIEITEVVSTYSEFTIIMNDEDVDQAFSIIKKLFN